MLICVIVNAMNAPPGHRSLGLRVEHIGTKIGMILFGDLALLPLVNLVRGFALLPKVEPSQEICLMGASTMAADGRLKRRFTTHSFPNLPLVVGPRSMQE